MSDYYRTNLSEFVLTTVIFAPGAMNPRSDRTAVARFPAELAESSLGAGGASEFRRTTQLNRNYKRTTPVCLGVGVPTAMAVANTASWSTNTTQWELQEQPWCALEWVCQ